MRYRVPATDPASWATNMAKVTDVSFCDPLMQAEVRVTVQVVELVREALRAACPTSHCLRARNNLLSAESLKASV